ncbi:hypothetical protein ACQSSU_20550 [Micromonospora echinospora]
MSATLAAPLPSTAVTGDDGTLILVAANHSPAGTHLTVGAGIQPENKRRWTGTDAVRLDQPSAAALAQLLTGMLAAADAAVAELADLTRQADRLEQQRRTLVDQQYPGRGAQLVSLDNWIAELTRKAAALEDRQEGRVARLDPADRAEYAAATGRQEQRAAVWGLTAVELAELDRLRSIPLGHLTAAQDRRRRDLIWDLERADRAVRFDRDLERADQVRRDLAAAQQERARLATDPVAVDVDEIARVAAEATAVTARIVALVDGKSLAAGTIRTEQGDLVCASWMTEGGPAHSLAVRPSGGGEEDGAVTPLTSRQLRRFAAVVRDAR